MFNKSEFDHHELQDFNDRTSADRVGSRIREVRVEQGVTQAALGKRVGLNADRIQKYENGVRKPKLDLLKEISVALGVQCLALSDPVVGNGIGAMYALFEMEKLYDLKVERIDDRLYLSFDDGCSGMMNSYLNEWEKEKQMIDEELRNASNEEDRKKILHAYKIWKWNYPYVNEKMSKESINEMKKAEIQKEIDKLQKELSSLEGADKKKK